MFNGLVHMHVAKWLQPEFGQLDHVAVKPNVGNCPAMYRLHAYSMGDVNVSFFPRR